MTLKMALYFPICLGPFLFSTFNSLSLIACFKIIIVLVPDKNTLKCLLHFLWLMYNLLSELLKPKAADVVLDIHTSNFLAVLVFSYISTHSIFHHYRQNSNNRYPQIE